MNRCAATKRRSTTHHSLSPSWLVAGSSAAPPFQLMRICNQRSHWLEACYCGWKLVIHSSYADSFFWAGSLIIFFGWKTGYIVLQAMKHATLRSTSSGSLNNRICTSQLLHRSRLLGLHGCESKPNWRHQQHKYGPAALVRTTASPSSKSSSSIE